MAFQFALDAFDGVEAAALVVNSIKNLAFSLGRDSSAVDRQKWLADSIASLQQIRNIVSEFVSNIISVLIADIFICTISSSIPTLQIPRTFLIVWWMGARDVRIRQI